MRMIERWAAEGCVDLSAVAWGLAAPLVAE